MDISVTNIFVKGERRREGGEGGEGRGGDEEEEEERMGKKEERREERRPASLRGQRGCPAPTLAAPLFSASHPPEMLPVEGGSSTPPSPSRLLHFLSQELLTGPHLHILWL